MDWIFTLSNISLYIVWDGCVCGMVPRAWKLDENSGAGVYKVMDLHVLYNNSIAGFLFVFVAGCFVFLACLLFVFFGRRGWDGVGVGGFFFSLPPLPLFILK